MKAEVCDDVDRRKQGNMIPRAYVLGRRLKLY